MNSNASLIPLGEIVSIKGGKRLPKGAALQSIKNSHPYIRVRDMGQRYIPTDGLEYVPDEVFPKIQRYIVHENDVIISIVGTIGLVSVIDSKFNLASQTENAAKLTGLDSIDAHYLYYYLNSHIGQSEIRQRTVGAVQPKLPLYNIETIPIIWPGRSSRTEVVKQLMALDGKIQYNHQINQTLEQMAQAIFKSWFVNFEPVKAKMAALEAGGSEDDALLAAMQAIAGSALFATDAADTDAQTQLARLQAEHPKQYNTLRATAELFPSAMQESELGEIPEGWVVSQIGDEVTVVGGGTPSTKNPEFWEGGTINWTTPKDLSNQVDKMLIDTDRRITQAGLNRISSGLLPVDTVLMSSRAPVGYLALAKTPIAVNQGYIAMKCEQTLSPEFVIQWCEVNMAEIKNRASGTTFAEISKKSFNIIPVLVPQESLISVYSKHIHQLYLKIEMSVRENKTLAELRDTLLPKLLSGELSISSAFTGQESCT